VCLRSIRGDRGTLFCNTRPLGKDLPTFIFQPRNSTKQTWLLISFKPREILFSSSQGEDGIKENLGLGNTSDFENQLLKSAMGELNASIQKGIDFAKKYA